MKTAALIFGIVLLLAAEILRIYFIMPFPGSQKSDSIGFAYWLGRNIVWIRILLLIIIAIPAIGIFKHGKRWKKITLGIVLAFYGVVFFFFNFRFEADKMFYQPVNKNFASGNSNVVSAERLVIGVIANGEAKAYPIEIIGYHHQVKDTIGGKPAIITYCSVCRTGRVYSPIIGGKLEEFRLVGMDHFNAMFEDATTKSWWQQATGKAITGEMKGKALTEIPSQQVTLASWMALYPDSKILQPDTVFKKRYAGMEGFDKGTINSSLEKRDSASWQFKSWVVGIDQKGIARAYDWNDLTKHQLIQDSIKDLPLLLTLAKDGESFFVLNRKVDGTTLQFERKDRETLTDLNTKSTWTNSGHAIDGPMKDKKLEPVQAYQEFWHSWQSFHPNTTQY